MATILGARGFDAGSSMLNSADMSNPYYVFVTTERAKTGNYSLFIGNWDDNWARWALAGSPNNPSVSVWINADQCYNINGNGTSGLNLRYLLGTGHWVELRWNGFTHTFDAYVNGNLFKAGTVEVSVNTWFHVQFCAAIATYGNITVLIDGHESINWHGNTQPDDMTGATYFYVYGGGSEGKHFYIDDLVFGYGGLLGDLRVYEMRPAGDALTEWTPSAGNDNYIMENETPPNDTTYTEANANGLQDELTLTPFDLTNQSCHAVIAWTRAKMMDGVGDSIDVGIDSGGVDSVRRSALSTQWEYYFGNVEMVNPNGGGTWTQSALDALKIRKVAVISS